MEPASYELKRAYFTHFKGIKIRAKFKTLFLINTCDTWKNPSCRQSPPLFAQLFKKFLEFGVVFSQFLNEPIRLVVRILFFQAI